ncbi:hypothetical protein AURDEDRAFT_140010 [Auricularia subglabra TFB-10046 SS5]|uniref:Hyaluronan/mRNA-binding protein domain-containing protein n=1 Tax=Auricularia subglabra (strain TFB-10046 / SS5) TaxID=717982 RepID=J0CZ17_AURST|nr:hypothetical protein AURDEDRAFT_140010 [Auricularia subglabra TFB-10046 SS5]
MTRTERASHPRALVKDRSESKSGLDKRVQKNGAGAHGWGSLADEVEHEMVDDLGADSDAEPVAPAAASSAPIPVRRSSGEPTEEEKEAARKVRQQALKDGQVDLGSIARTSAAVSHSPPKAGLQAPLADAPATATLPQVQ